MILTTTDTIPGTGLAELLGLVDGVGVVWVSLNNPMAPTEDQIANVIVDARTRAMEKMIEMAKAKGADAVVGIRYSTSSAEYMDRAHEVIVYGTAAKISKT